MKETPHSSNLPSIVQYHLGPERPVFDHVSQQLKEYKLYTFDGHLCKTINKVHEYNHVHEYEKVREYEAKEYQYKEYEYKEYKANFITKAQYKALNALKTSKKRKNILPPIPKETVVQAELKRKSSTQKDPMTHVREYEYKEYEFKPYDISKVDSYMDRPLEEYKRPKTYKLNDINFPPLKNISEDDTDYLKKYKSLRPVIFPKWIEFESPAPR